MFDVSLCSLLPSQVEAGRRRRTVALDSEGTRGAISAAEGEPACKAPFTGGQINEAAGWFILLFN